MDGRQFKKITYCIGIAACSFAASCRPLAEKNSENEAWQHKLDSIGNATLDSIYKRESVICDRLQKMRIPILVDSLVNDDLLKKMAIKK